MIYMFLSNNPSSGDINLSNLSCYFIILDCFKNRTVLKETFNTMKLSKLINYEYQVSK